MSYPKRTVQINLGIEDAQLLLDCCWAAKWTRKDNPGQHPTNTEAERLANIVQADILAAREAEYDAEYDRQGLV